MTKRDDTFICDECGTTVPELSEETRAWDWFKGVLNTTRHYCPTCRNSEQHDLEFRAAYAQQGGQS